MSRYGAKYAEHLKWSLEYLALS